MKYTTSRKAKQGMDMLKQLHANGNPQLRKQLEQETPDLFKKEKVYSFKKDDVRSYALKSLHPIAGLTQSQRARVIAYMSKLNEVN